ncbi:MAG: YggT family protein, partial [Spirochaetaceae bacterium]|nr:YggT family protein [Spirochaetaceae bacterium]
MAVSIVARILSAVVTVYMFVCLARVLLSWFPGMETGRGGELLKSVADPYMGYFRRFAVLRSGAFDFSPLAALSVLVVLNDLLTTVAFAMRLSLGLVLGMVLGAAWSAFGFVLSFFAVCALMRIVAFAARWNSLHPVWMLVDSMLNPVLYRINRLFYRG